MGSELAANLGGPHLSESHERSLAGAKEVGGCSIEPVEADLFTEGNGIEGGRNFTRRNGLLELGLELADRRGTRTGNQGGGFDCGLESLIDVAGAEPVVEIGVIGGSIDSIHFTRGGGDNRLEPFLAGPLPVLLGIVLRKG